MKAHSTNIVLLAIVVLAILMVGTNKTHAVGQIDFNGEWIDDCGEYVGNCNGVLDPGEGRHAGHRVKLYNKMDNDQPIERLTFDWKLDRNCGSDYLRFYDGNSNVSIGAGCSYLYMELEDHLDDNEGYDFVWFVEVNANIDEADTVRFKFNDQRYKDTDGDYHDDDDDTNRVAFSNQQYIPPTPPENLPPAAVVIEPLDPVNNDDDVQLNFSRVAYADGYHVYRSDDGDPFALIDTINDSMASDYSDSFSEGCYQWKVNAFNEHGEGEDSNTVYTCYEEAPSLTKPTGVSVSPTEYEDGDTLRLSWNSVLGATRYEIYGYWDGALGSIIETDETYQDYTTFGEYSEMSWQVRAENSEETGPWSDLVHAGIDVPPPPETGTIDIFFTNLDDDTITPEYRVNDGEWQNGPMLLSLYSGSVLLEDQVVGPYSIEMQWLDSDTGETYNQGPITHELVAYQTVTWSFTIDANAPPPPQTGSAIITVQNNDNNTISYAFIGENPFNIDSSPLRPGDSDTFTANDIQAGGYSLGIEWVDPENNNTYTHGPDTKFINGGETTTWSFTIDYHGPPAYGAIEISAVNEDDDSIRPEFSVDGGDWDNSLGFIQPDGSSSVSIEDIEEGEHTVRFRWLDEDFGEYIISDVVAQSVEANSTTNWSFLITEHLPVTETGSMSISFSNEDDDALNPQYSVDSGPWTNAGLIQSGYSSSVSLEFVTAGDHTVQIRWWDDDVGHYITSDPVTLIVNDSETTTWSFVITEHLETPAVGKVRLTISNEDDDTLRPQYSQNGGEWIDFYSLESGETASLEFPDQAIGNHSFEIQWTDPDTDSLYGSRPMTKTVVGEQVAQFHFTLDQHGDGPPAEINSPPSIYNIRSQIGMFVGDQFGVDGLLHDANDDYLNVVCYLDGEIVEEKWLTPEDYSFDFKYFAGAAKDYHIWIVVRDGNGGEDHFEYTFSFIERPQVFRKYFEVRQNPERYYYEGSVYTKEALAGQFRSEFGMDYLIEPHSEYENWYYIEAITPEEVSVLQAGGDILLGFVDRCDEDSSGWCTGSNIATSSIPVVEEVQELTSLTINIIFAAYEGSVYLIARKPAYADKAKESLTNVGFAASGFVCPFVVDPQGARAYYKATKHVSGAIKDAHRQADRLNTLIGDDVLKLALRNHGYSDEVIDASMLRIKSLDSMKEVMEKPGNLEFFAKVERDLGSGRADDLVDLIKHYEDLQIDSQHLLTEFKTIGFKRFSLDPNSSQFDTFKELSETKALLETLEQTGGDPVLITDLRGVYAELRQNFYVDSIGGLRIEGLKNKHFRDLDIDWIGGEFDDVIISPYNPKELWIFEVKHGYGKLGKAKEQLDKIDGKIVQHLKDSGLIPTNIEKVRKIAWVDRTILEPQGPIDVVLNWINHTVVPKSAMAVEVDSEVSYFIVGEEEVDPPEDPDDDDDEAEKIDFPCFIIVAST